MLIPSINIHMISSKKNKPFQTMFLPQVVLCRCHGTHSVPLGKQTVSCPRFSAWRERKCFPNLQVFEAGDVCFFPPFFAAPPSCQVSFFAVFLVALNLFNFLRRWITAKLRGWCLVDTGAHIVMLEFEKLSLRKTSFDELDLMHCNCMI